MVAMLASRCMLHSGRPQYSLLSRRSGTGRSATLALAPTIHAAVLPTKGDDAEGGTGSSCLRPQTSPRQSRACPQLVVDEFSPGALDTISLAEARVRVYDFTGLLSAGAGLLDRPGLDRTAVLDRPRTDSGEGARDRGSKITGGGNFRLLLLDDPGHTEPHVVKVSEKYILLCRFFQLHSCDIIRPNASTRTAVASTIQERAGLQHQPLAVFIGAGHHEGCSWRR